MPAVSGAAATALALTSAAFKTTVGNDTYAFYGAADASHCGKLETIDANFAVTSASGTRRDVVAALNVSFASLPTTVAFVTTLPAVSFCSGSQCYSGPDWSGYQFCQQSGGSSCPSTPNTVAQGALMTFTQPNVYVPTGSGAPSCNNSVGCDFSTWV